MQDDPEQLQSRELKKKLSWLTTDDLAEQQLGEPSLERESDEAQGAQKGDEGKQAQQQEQKQGYTQWLFNQVLANIKLELHNIHLRYEDDISIPSSPFVAGFTIKKLLMVRQNGEWQTAFVTETDGAEHRKATVENFSAYWSVGTFVPLAPEEDGTLVADATKNELVVSPLNATAYLTIRKDQLPSAETAPCEVAVDVETFHLRLNNRQYKQCMRLLDMWTDYNKSLQSRIYRPHDKVADAPRKWWHYTRKGLMADYREKAKRASWDSIQTFCAVRREYVTLRRKVNAEVKMEEQEVQRLEALERELPYDDITFFRVIARCALKFDRLLIVTHEELIQQQREEQKAQQDETQGKQQGGWFSSWWYGSSGSNTEQDDSPIERGELMELTDGMWKEVGESVCAEMAQQ